jgi:peptide/nickel transport system substrate-binding protein/oligopeptide transport system substrate-binding protein
VAREALMHQAEDMLMGTGAIVPIYYYNDMLMMRNTLQGFYANAFGSKYFMYATNGDSDTLRLQLASEPARLDPHLNSSSDGGTLAINSFGGLYTYNAEGVTAPHFAEGYEVSEDGTTYTIKMKDGLKWSDGSPLTAKDFEYSWKRASNPETAADYSYMYDVIAGYGTEEGLNVTASEDGLTLTVVLKTPCAYFEDLMAFPTYFPVKQEAVEAAAGYLDADGKVVNPGAWALEAGFPSSGAYMLESWVHQESMVYVKNPNYFDAANVKLERLEFMLSADDTVVYSAYRSGDLDYCDTVPPDEIPNLLGKDPEFHVIPNLGTYYMCFNVKSPLFEGKTVEQAAAMRTAISKLIDRQYIIDTVAQTGQEIATSYIPAGMLDGHGGVFKANDDAYTFPVGTGYISEAVDVEGAIALLESAGFVFENGVLSASTPLSFEYITNEGAGHVGTAECMQQDLAAVGINMTVKTVEWDTFLEERKAGNYDVARNGWLADFNDPINMLEMWTTASGNNECQFGR